VKGGKNKDKKIVLMRLIIQGKKPSTTTTKFSLLGKSSGLIPLVYNPGIGTWYSGLWGEGCCPSSQTACGGDNWRVFFLLSLVLWGHPLQAGALKWSYQMTGL
jgi:hypothetical protein